MAKASRSVPAPLAQAARRFESWRRNRTTRRIPEELWDLAAGLGVRFGVSRTALALRLQYYDLAKRVSPDRPPRATAAPEDTAPAFVEILTSPARAESSSIVVEFERAGGDRMRIEMKGAGASQLSELSRLFLAPRP
jgi:hypothetical protein